MVNILGFVIRKKLAISLSPFPNLLQAAHDVSEFLRREHASMLERAGVGAASLKLVRQKTLIKRERTLPAFELGIERLPEAARPHLHFATSWRSCARERDGRP